MSKKLLVISMDAMVGEDIPLLMEKPNFSRLMASWSGSLRAKTIYPSVTYPAHVSIATGCRPGKSGVFNNTAVHANSIGYDDWLYDSANVKVEDIFAAAKRAGLSTAAVYWPVTGCNRNIDYLINEYFFPFENETVEEGFRKWGANDEAMSVVEKNMDRWPTEYKNRKGLVKLSLKHTYDNFINGCTCTMIRDLNPDVLFVHNCIMDTWRHRFGIFHQYTIEGLDQVDAWFGEIIDAIESRGSLDDYNVVVLSDHGQMNVARIVKLNLILRRGGFIDCDESGKIVSWRALAHSTGMSGYIYLSDPEDKALYNDVKKYLDEKCADGVWGFSKVRTVEECRADYGLYGDFSFMVETDGITAFSDSPTEPIMNPKNVEDYRLGSATHGYEPEKGPQPVFLCRGPLFKKNVRLEKMETIDEAPTLAVALGDRLEGAEGRILSELLA